MSRSIYAKRQFGAPKKRMSLIGWAVLGVLVSLLVAMLTAGTYLILQSDHPVHYLGIAIVLFTLAYALARSADDKELPAFLATHLFLDDA